MKRNSSAPCLASLLLVLLVLLVLGQAGAQGGGAYRVVNIDSTIKDKYGKPIYSVTLQNIKKPQYIHSVSLHDISGIGINDIVQTTFVNGHEVIVGHDTSKPDPFPIEKKLNRVWSGIFWPDIPDNGPTLYDGSGPLAKYDRLTGKNTRKWEEDHHSHPSADAAGYQGHCDGWSISSILCPEPKRAVVARKGSSPEILFEIGDVKGLLAARWSGYTWKGDDSAGGTSLSVWDFHRFLLFYLDGYNMPLVVNIPPVKNAVWNYPCDGFTMTGTPDPKVQNRWNIKVRLYLADDMEIDKNCTKRKEKTYDVSYSITGKDPAPSKEEILNMNNQKKVLPGAWVNQKDLPVWIFAPRMNTPYSSTHPRHHEFVDSTFETIVKGLLEVSSGKDSNGKSSDSWSFGEYSVKVAPKH